MKNLDKDELLEDIFFKCAFTYLCLLFLYIAIYGTDEFLFKTWIISTTTVFHFCYLRCWLKNTNITDDKLLYFELCIFGPITILSVTSTLIIYSIKVNNHEEYEGSDSEKRDGDT